MNLNAQLPQQGSREMDDEELPDYLLPLRPTRLRLDTRLRTAAEVVALADAA